MPRHLISDAHEWINEIPTVPIYYLAKPQPRERAWQNQRGKKTLCHCTQWGLLGGFMPPNSALVHNVQGVRFNELPRAAFYGCCEVNVEAVSSPGEIVTTRGRSSSGL